MTTLQAVILLLVTAAVAAVISRVGTREQHAGIGYRLATCVVALPFGLLLAAPFAPPEGAPPRTREAAGSGVQAAAACQVRLLQGDVGSGSRYTVRPVRCRPDDHPRTTFRLDGARIRSSEGAQFRIVPGWVAGHVDRSVAEADRGLVSGWTASLKAHRPIRRILVFINGAFVAAMPPTVDRPDIARVHGAALRRSGFDFELPLSDLPTGPGARVKLELFGVDQDRASPIAPDCAAEPQSFAC